MKEQEIPKGYKRTEVGIIPEEWEVKTLGELGQFKNGINKNKSEFGRGYPFVNLMDVFGVPRLSGRTACLGLVNSTSIERKTYDLRKGDILFVRSSVKPEGVGLSSLVDETLPSTVFSGFLVRYRPNDKVVPAYLQYCFNEERFHNRLIANSTVSANTNINQNVLKRFIIAFPCNLAEQRAIAEVLADVDGLLAALDKLIAKKRAIKKAAMQQLLTGKTRLPGFSGEWEVKRLGEIASIKSGATPSTRIPAYWDGTIPWCTPTDITATSGKYLTITERRITQAGLVSCAADLLPDGALLLCSRATIGEVKIAGMEVCTNQGFKPLVCKECVFNEFLYYFLLTLKPKLIERANGSTFLEISKRDIATIQVNLPPHIEQSAIASVLSDMDAEIEALERRREKTRQVKQGMMEQLLTGRVRLVKEHWRHAGKNMETKHAH